jgi:hypothetical protein
VVIEDPPLFGALQDTESVDVPVWFVPDEGVGVLTDGAAMVAGTVVIVIAVVADEEPESPDALEATTVKVGVLEEPSPSTVTGDEDPVPVCPVEAVTK